MRLKPIIVISALLLSSVALAVGFTLTATSDTVFTDCGAGGSAAQTLSAVGPYWVRTAAAEGLWMCLAASGATCASGGVFLPPNSSVLLNFSGAQLSVACRSALATGDLYIAGAQ